MSWANCLLHSRKRANWTTPTSFTPLTWGGLCASADPVQNGYHLGQFRLPTSKQQIYETDIHLPLYVRGPGIKSGVELDALVGNVDIAPTLLDLAGAQKDDMDGKSLMPHLVSGSEKSAHPWRTSFLVEYLSVGSVRPFPAITHVHAVLLRSQPDLVAWANVGGPQQGRT
mmetsp:Transcript_26512/g.57466  ORF Transcript_26512/g.57466 Transcript_26512/m.57466 type:complete len:170 (-) Transcript_26512:328-837(-)